MSAPHVSSVMTFFCGRVFLSNIEVRRVSSSSQSIPLCHPHYFSTYRKPRTKRKMKLSIVASVALCMASATSFTVGPQTKAVSRSLPRNPTVSLKMSEALAAQEAFAKAEIDSNDVSFISFCCFAIALLLETYNSFSRWLFFRRPTAVSPQRRRNSSPS